MADKPLSATRFLHKTLHVLAVRRHSGKVLDQRAGLTTKRLIGFRGVDAVESDTYRGTTTSDCDGIPVGYAGHWIGEDIADLRRRAYRPGKREQNMYEERTTRCGHTVSLL